MEEITKNRSVNRNKCCVISCTSTYIRNRALHVHKFPKTKRSFVERINRFVKKGNVDRRKLWMRIVKLPKVADTEQKRVCSLHFKKKNYCEIVSTVFCCTFLKLVKRNHHEVFVFNLLILLLTCRFSGQFKRIESNSCSER